MSRERSLDAKQGLVGFGQDFWCRHRLTFSILKPCFNAPRKRADDLAVTTTEHCDLLGHPRAIKAAQAVLSGRCPRWSLTADPDFELSTENMFREAWIPAIKSGGYRNWQLFDLETDPGQKTNLAAAKPEIAEGLKAQLLRINASVMADGADWHLPE